MHQMIVFGLAAVIVALVLVVFKNNQRQKFDKFLKIIALVFCAIAFFRFFLSDAFVFVINGATFNGTYYDETDVLQTVLRWGYYLNVTVLPMAIFFDSRLFKNLLSYVCLPFSILSAIFINTYMPYFLSIKGGGLHFAEWFRYAYFIIELALAIAIPVIMQIKHKHVLNVKDKKECLTFAMMIPLMFAMMMPPYVPQSLIGYSSLLAEIGSLYYFAWMGLSLVFILVLYFVFRFKDYKSRYMLCMFLTVTLFFHYNSIFLMGFSLPRLPIQLCNLAAYIYIIAIPFRRKKLFQFCYLANITGAIIAFVAADFSGGAFGFWNMHFVYEHTLVLAVPALAMGLRIFPRIEKKALKYTFIGFTIYFFICLMFGTLINGYAGETGVKVNYFFMFDLKKAFNYVPFLTMAGNLTITFGRFEIYPVIVLVIYFAFTLLYVAFYWLTKYLYKFEDDRLELRESAIQIYEKITKKKSKLPREFKD